MEYLYALFIYPIEMFIETVFSISIKMIPSVGYAIIFVSIAVQLLAFPMYKRADEIQDEVRAKQDRLSKWIAHIKKTFSGDERLMMLSEYYRQNNFQPWHSLKGMLPLLLQIPFFIAAYEFLSNCPALSGASFYFLKDLGKPDEALCFGDVTVNVLPIAMTVINIMSGLIYTRGLSLKDKVQLFVTAGVFLVLLYDSPSGLVFYWTLNNVFSLLKNIFMKVVKHPREIITVAAPVAAVAYCYKSYSYGAFECVFGRIVITGMLISGFLPVVFYLLKRFTVRNGIKKDYSIQSEDKTIFIFSGIICAVTLGVLIPATTMASSPTEFVIRGHYVNPLIQVLYSLFVAVGLFVLWGNLIFAFNSNRAKRTICIIMLSIAAGCVVNYQFFRQGLYYMSLYMVYNDDISYSARQCIINLIVLIVVFTCCVVAYRINKRIVVRITGMLLVTVAMLSSYSVYRVYAGINSVPEIKDDSYYLDNDVHFTLDKTGDNVIVFMLDRAYGPYLPYIMHEKPELAESYSGFTYYSNTISHGMKTLVGAPGLFGGYEYTACNAKDLEEKEYEEFYNESFMVLPKLFSQNDYSCTVIDSPAHIANKNFDQWFKEIDPKINAYQADEVMKSPEEALRDYRLYESAAHNNYIRHSFFISAPLFLRSFLYDDGSYLSQQKTDERMTFAGHIEELNKLPDMTTISDDGVNTVTFIKNDTPHSMNVNLQMPDYTLENSVDNSEYLSKWRKILNDTPGDRGISLHTDSQVQSYEVNMATIMSIANWLEYLKKQGVYDNTRIIFAGDHGFYYRPFGDEMLFQGWEDVGAFMPLLMVKDFTDDGGSELVYSDDFMTNADVPSIAVDGLIDKPVNPYTGNPIDSSPKNDIQYVFDGDSWLTVHDDIMDLSNWNLVDVKYSNIMM